MLCFGKFPVAKKFVDEKDGGGVISKISTGNILSHTTENFRRETV